MLAALTELTESGEGNDCGCRAKAQLVSIPHPGSSLGQMHGPNGRAQFVPTPKINM